MKTNETTGPAAAAIAQAEREIKDTGELGIAARRVLWQAFGPLEPRAENDPAPRPFTKAHLMRTQLALACARKVMRIWSAYDEDDKTPQTLLKRTKAYMDGKLSAAAAQKGDQGIIDHIMAVVDNEPDSTAPAAALAAWEAYVTAMEDEPLLKPEYEGIDDLDIDPYDWDAAKNASVAWGGADETATPGRCKVRCMKFWAWYLEEAAKLLGMEGYKFPAKAIKAFDAKVNPPRPVPEEVALENLTDFMYVGKFRYCYAEIIDRHTRKPEKGMKYVIVSRMVKDWGICEECKKRVTNIDHYDHASVEMELPDGTGMEFVEEFPRFRCPDCIRSMVNPGHEYISESQYAAAFKRYTAAPDSAGALLAQLAKRAIVRLDIEEEDMSLNRHDLSGWWFTPQFFADGRIPGLVLTDGASNSFAVDVRRFGPHIMFLDLPYAEFVQAYPERVKQAGERITEIEFVGQHVRCFLDEDGELERMELTTRFHVKVIAYDCAIPNMSKRERLVETFEELFSLSKEEARKLKKQQERDRVHYDGILPCLCGFTYEEAVRAMFVLHRHQLGCRIEPPLIDKECEKKDPEWEL